MRKRMVLILCSAFLVVTSQLSSLAFDAKALKGEELFTRSNLKAKGRKIFFHNMSCLKGFIPVGTAVKITRAGGSAISFKVLENGKKYTIHEPSQYWAKYFVRNLDEIGLEKMNEQRREKIKGNSLVVAKGMTKKEVFAIKGCPAYIGYGERSTKHSLDQIMDSDTWYYNKDSRMRESTVIFTNGLVDKVQTRISTLKVE